MQGFMHFYCEKLLAQNQDWEGINQSVGAEDVK